MRGAIKKLQAVDSTLEKMRDLGLLAAVGTDPIRTAFKNKTAVHPGSGSKPLASEVLAEKLQELYAVKREGPASGYVHIPYCETMCLYCGFFGGKYSPELEDKYVAALLRDVEMAQDRPVAHGAPLNALYLGGGTPTALRAANLKKVLTVLRQALPLSNDCEITVEGRIANFDQEKMEACLEAGANRFSLGVQSFNTKLRRSIGRLETKEVVIERLKRLKSYNQAAVIVDLIYGLPGQSVADWKEDVRLLLELELDGADLYQLNVFADSGLSKAIAAGKVPAVAPLERQGDYFLAGRELMLEACYTRLSISHWGRTTRERNFYNPLAKRRADCLQFGSRAGGVIAGHLLINNSKADAYIDSCMRGENPVQTAMTPPANFPLMREISAQMEVCRLDLPKLSERLVECGSPETRAEVFFGPIFDNWREVGLAEYTGKFIVPTEAGEFWQTNLTQAMASWQFTLLTDA